MRRCLTVLISCILLLSAFYLPTKAASIQEVTFKLEADSGDGVVRLKWEEVPGAVQGYYIYRGSDEGQESETPLTDFGVLGTTYYDTKVTNDQRYCYYIIPLDANARPFGRSNEDCASPSEKYPSYIRGCEIVLVFTVGNKNFLVNGVEKLMPVPFTQRGNRTYLPIRYVTENVDGKVEWNGVERKVTIQYKTRTIEMWIGKPIAKVNGQEFPIDPNDPKVVPYIDSGYTFIPLRFPVEKFGEGEVKWYATSKQAVITFPDRCEETRRGSLTIYDEISGMGELIGFDGEVYSIIIPANLIISYRPMVGDCIEVTGRNDNPDFPGYIVCSIVTRITCPETGGGTWEGVVESKDCNNGFIMVKIADNPNVKPWTFGRTLKAILPINIELMKDFCSFLNIGDCVRISGVLIQPKATAVAIPSPIINIRKISKIDCESKDSNSCDGEWYSGIVISFDCLDGSAKILVNTEVVIVELPDDFDCGKLKEGICVRFCGKRVLADRMTAQILKAYQCDSVCGETIFRGKLLKFDCNNSIIQVSQGDKYIKIDISGLDCQRMVEMIKSDCVEVCAIENGLGYWVAISVKPLKDDDCKEVCKGRSIVATIDRVDCDKGSILCTLPWSGKQIEIKFEYPSFCQLEVGKCYEICLETDKLIAKSYKEIQCPETCDGRTVIGSVLSSDCDKGIIKVIVDGVETTLIISSIDCNRLKIGDCVKFCIVTDITGGMRVQSFKVLDPKECEQKKCEGIEGIVHVVDFDCDAMTMKIEIIEAPIGEGMTVSVPINQKSLCKILQKDICLKVCILQKGFFEYEILDWEILPPERCGLKTPDCEGRKIIGSVTDCSDGMLALDVGGELYYLTIDQKLCEKVNAGDCVKVCTKLNMTTSLLQVVSIEGIDEKECESQQDCKENLKVKVDVVNCDARYIECKEIEQEKAHKFFFKEDMAEFFCGMRIGGCYEICLDIDDKGSLYLKSYKAIDCPEAPCDGFKLIAYIDKVNCDKLTAYVVTDKIILPIKVPSSICRFLKSGCNLVCLKFGEDGFPVLVWATPLPEEKCPIISKCSEKSDTGKIVAQYCDIGVIKVQTSEALLTLSVDPDTCPFLKKDLCIVFCFKYEDEIFKAAWVHVMPDKECVPKECEEVKGVVTVRDCENDLITIKTNGNLLNIKVNPDDCANIDIGDCLRACISPIIGTDTFKTVWLKTVSKEECEETPCDKVIKIRLEAVNCNGMYIEGIYLETNVGFKLFFDDKKLCDLVKGKCYELCVKNDASGKPILKNAKPIDCPKKICDKELRIKINKLWCENRYMEATDLNNGDNIVVRFDDDDAADFCRLVENVCYEICLVKDEAGNFILKRAGKIECPETCEGRVIRTKIIRIIKDKETALILIDNDPIEFSIPKNILDTLDEGMCVEICIDHDDAGNLILRTIKVLDQKECDFDCDGRVFEGRVISTQESKSGLSIIIYGFEPQILIPRDPTTGKIIKVVKVGECVRLCVGFDPDSKNLIAKKVIVLPPDNCPGTCDDGEILEGIITQSYCEKGILIIKRSGSIWTIRVSEELCKRFKVGDCVVVCGKWMKEIETFISVWVRHLPESHCQSPCDGKITKAKVERLDCANNIAYLNIGGEVKPVTIPERECKGLEIGMCVEVCLNRSYLTNTLSSKWIIILETKECEIKACDGQIIRATVANNWCDDKVAYVWLNGNKYPLVGYNKETECTIYKPGMCIEICGSFENRQTLVPGITNLIKANSIKVLPLEYCDQECKGDSWVVSILTIDYSNGAGTFINKETGINYNFHIPPSLLKDIKEGICVLVCGRWLEERKVFIVDWLKIMPKEKCELPCKTVLVNIVRIDCEKGMIYYYNSSSPNVVIGAQISSELCKKLLSQTIPPLTYPLCAKVCFKEQTSNLPVVANIELLPPGQCQDVCTGPTMKGTVTNLESPEKVFIKAGNIDLQVIVPVYIFDRLKKGMCVQMCTHQDEKGNLVSTWFKVLPSSECEPGGCQGQTMNLTVYDKDCKYGKLTAYDHIGQIFTLGIDPKICEEVIVGACYQFCMTKSELGNFKVTTIKKNSDGACDGSCKLIRASVITVECSSRSVVIRCQSKDSGYTVTLSANLCNDYKNAKCIEFCIELKDGNPTGKIVSGVRVIPEELCGGLPNPCDGAMKWHAKVLRKSCELGQIYIQVGNQTKLVIVKDSKQCESLQAGSCYVFCVKYVNESYILEYAITTASELCDMPCLDLTITKLYCDRGMIEAVNENKMYYVIDLPSDIACSSLKVGDCITVCGKMEENIFVAEVFGKRECRKPQSWYMYVFSESCSPRANIRMITARREQIFFSVYLPDNFDCANVAPGDCIRIEGFLRDDQGCLNCIDASSLVKIACEPAGTYLVKILSKFCDKRYLRVSYPPSEYNFYYPSTFDCNSVNVGDCLQFTGTIWTKGYIDVYTVQKVECPKQEQTWTLFITNADCQAMKYFGRAGNTYFVVNLPKGFTCNQKASGQCFKITGTLSSSGSLTHLSNLINASKIEAVSCPQSSQLVVKIKEVHCSDSSPGLSYLVVTYSNRDYFLYFPSWYSCGRFIVGNCLQISGNLSTSDAYIYAYSIGFVACPYHIKIAEVVCGRAGRYAIFYMNRIKYTLYFPQGFDCTKVKVNDCYYVEGSLDTNKKTLSSTKMVKENCP